MIELIGFVLACVFAAAYWAYGRYLAYCERFGRARAEILSAYEPVFFEALSQTPILTNGERVLIRANLTIAVTAYYPRQFAYESIFHRAEQAVALWATSLSRSEDAPRQESYTALTMALTALSCPVAKVTAAAITTIVPLKKGQPPSVVDEIELAVRRRVQLQVLKNKYAHDPAIVELIERREEGDSGILDDARLR